MLGSLLARRSRSNPEKTLSEYLVGQFYHAPIMIAGFAGFDELYSVGYVFLSRLRKPFVGKGENRSPALRGYRGNSCNRWLF